MSVQRRNEGYILVAQKAVCRMLIDVRDSRMLGMSESEPGAASNGNVVKTASQALAVNLASLLGENEE